MPVSSKPVHHWRGLHADNKHGNQLGSLGLSIQTFRLLSFQDCSLEQPAVSFDTPPAPYRTTACYHLDRYSPASLCSSSLSLSWKLQLKNMAELSRRHAQWSEKESNLTRGIARGVKRSRTAVEESSSLYTSDDAGQEPQKIVPPP